MRPSRTIRLIRLIGRAHVRHDRRVAAIRGFGFLDYRKERNFTESTHLCATLENALFDMLATPISERVS